MACTSVQVLVLLVVWVGARSCLKMKSASPYRSSAEGIMKTSKTLTVALITALMRRSIEAVSLWHCPEVMVAQVSMMLTVSSFGLFFDLVPLIFLLIIPHRFSIWGLGPASCLSSQAPWWHGVQCSMQVLVGKLCFLKSKITTAVYQNVFHDSFCWSHWFDAILIS